MINTTLCYIEQNGKYLLLHRIKKKKDINKDKWIGIGGKFEEWESPEDCIHREALEETGLTLIRPKYRGIVTFISDGMDQTEFMYRDRIYRYAQGLRRGCTRMGRQAKGEGTPPLGWRPHIPCTTRTRRTIFFAKAHLQRE